MTELVADTSGVCVTSALTDDDADTVDETDADAEIVPDIDLVCERDCVAEELSERVPVEDGDTERLTVNEPVADVLKDVVAVGVTESEGD